MSRSQAAALAAKPFAELPTPADATRRHFANDPNPVERMREKIEPFLGGVELFLNRVLVVQYIRPEKTAGGIYIDPKEDVWQGKAGLVVKIGPHAFIDSEHATFGGQRVEINDWVYFHIQDGRLIKIAGVDCRILTDRMVIGKIARPDLVY